MGEYQTPVIEKLRYEIEKALKVNPDYPALHFQPGVVYSAGGRKEEAKIALKIDPMNSSFHSNLAFFYADKGMYNDATREYRKALELDPDNPELHSKLGVLYGDRGMVDDTIGQFKKAIFLDADFDPEWDDYAEAGDCVLHRYSSPGLF